MPKSPAPATKKAPVKKAAAKKAPAKKTTKPPAVESSNRGKPVYQEPSVRLLVGENAMTEDIAKQLLGWEVVTDKDAACLLTDKDGNNIRCTNNDRNRPLRLNDALLYSQEVLRGNWRFNGESAVIGKYGQTISFQHRGIGLILACQLWRKEPEKYPHWKTPPTMDLLIAFGVDESDEVVNTIDTGVVRSFTDVMYRSDYFADLKPDARREMARTTDYAVKQIWERLGVEDAHDIRKTHAESFGLIQRHPRIIKAATHIYEEDKGRAVSKYTTGAGYAAGLMFLMGCSASDPTAYNADQLPHEGLLDWSLWDKAADFFVSLAQGDKSFGDFREAISALARGEGPNGIHVPGSRAERLATIVKAWTLYAQDKPIMMSDILLKYGSPDDEGICRLIECPTVGGIDRGSSACVAEDDAENDAPSAEQIAERAAAIKAQNQKQPPRRPSTADIGHKVWVVDPENPEANWYGELVRLAGDKAFIKAGKGLPTHGKTFDAPFSQVQTNEP